MVLYNHDYTYTPIHIYVQSHINTVHLTLLIIEVDQTHVQYKQL